MITGKETRCCLL